LPADLADGRVHVDNEASREGHGAPGSPEHLADDRFELADMAEGEGPKERPERRRYHDPVTEDPFGCTGPQHVGVVDEGGAGDHGVNEGEHLAPW